MTLSDVGVDFGATTILNDVSFTVDAGERWGIVGRNGAGKTTLFRLIAGSLEPTRGGVHRSGGVRVAQLDQYRNFGDATTVWQAAALGYRDLIELEASLARQANRLAESGDGAGERELARYGRDQERFVHAGGYEFHARVDAVLQGIGFDPTEAAERALDGLSGGERGRIGLASHLAAPADLVLLDEPTNHLDLETIEWLQRYLSDLKATVLVISHDRAFLDEFADHTLHVAQGTATAYRGGYSSFARQRAERLLTLERQVTQQQRFIAKEEDFIRRNIAGQKTAQAKGRRTRLARLPRLTPPPSDDDAMGLRFDVAERGGDQVLIADRLDVSVAGRKLVRDFSAVAHRGDIIALVGPNGAGKTTLLATLLGHRPAAAGSTRLGAGITAAWFRQDLAQLPTDRRIYDCIADLRPTWTRGSIQGHLGRFAFTGDEVFRRTTDLSGGERARVALASMVLADANLLVLDEPSNHLDVESIEALEDALERFAGTTILVSHDRALLRELATRVWAFDGARVEDYQGTFVDWEQRTTAAVARQVAEAERADREGRDAQRSRARRDAARRRDREGARRAAKDRVAETEAAVHRLERRLADLDAQLADTTLYDGSAEAARRAADLTRERAERARERDAALDTWAEAVEAADGIEHP